jgi:FHA domain
VEPSRAGELIARPVVAVVASPEVEACAQRAGFVIARTPAEADVVVFAPARLGEARACALGEPYRSAPLPMVAFVAAAVGWDLVTTEAVAAVGVRADAYAGDVASLADAVRWVLDPAASAERAREGPLRITYLGSLGEPCPPLAPRIGGSVPLGEIGATLLVGRDETRCGVCLRQGPHSDQNTVGPKHATFERSAGGATVKDRRTTNGTYVHGESILEMELAPGDEVAVAWSHRLRLDGAVLTRGGPTD